MPYPSLPLPPPLRGSDGSFTHYTVSQRLPRIARQVIAENNWPAEVNDRLLALANALPVDRLPPLVDPDAPDEANWNDWLAPYLGQTWLEAPWFVIETYFFRRILALTGYFQPGAGQDRDPYRVQKQLGLEQIPSRLAELSEQLQRWQANPPPDLAQTLTGLIHQALWGNQSDLSMWPASSGSQPEGSQSTTLVGRLVCDQAATAAGWLVTHAPLARIDIILDNGGLELAHDLALADFLLTHRLAYRLVFHCKIHPTYVSDVTRQDLAETLQGLQQSSMASLAALGDRLVAGLAGSAITLQAHPFWTSPLSSWEMPAGLAQELRQSGLIINKGDANYRRWLGDRHWAPDAPLGRILSYRPAPWLALRVLKSEMIAGLAPGAAERAASQDPTWQYAGRWGIAQALL